MNCLKKFRIFWVFLFLIIGCSNKKTENYSKYLNKADEWSLYAEEINIEQDAFKNSVFLILQSTECVPCLNELAWWNEQASEFKNINTRLIIIEKYSSTFDIFLDQNQINLKAYRDSIGIVLKKNLIPTTPLKVFFDEDSKIKAIEKIGSNGNLSRFLQVIKQFQN